MHESIVIKMNHYVLENQSSIPDNGGRDQLDRKDGEMHRYILMLAMSVLVISGCSPDDRSILSATPAGRRTLQAAENYPTRTYDAELLKTDARVRREAAWEIVGKITSPLEVKTTLPGGGDLQYQTPLFATWYDATEVALLFRSAYEALGSDRRRLRNPVSSADYRIAEEWLVRRVEDMPHWTAERLRNYMLTYGRNDRAISLTGPVRILYSPGLVRHLLQNYALGAHCARQQLDTACFNDDMPADAVAVKLNWVPADEKISVTATDAAAMRALFAGTAWPEPSVIVNPDPDSVLTTESENGNRFRLAGMHIMSKELKKWFWITLWWSNDKNSDFGADHPADLSAVFANYKMCAVTSDRETQQGDFSEYPSLAAATEALAEVTDGYSWCSNAHLEHGAGNQVTNCIGCHQHAGTPLRSEDILNDPLRFPGGGRQEVRQDFPADYIFSHRTPPEQLGLRLASIIDFFDTQDQ